MQTKSLQSEGSSYLTILIVSVDLLYRTMKNYHIPINIICYSFPIRGTIGGLDRLT